MDSFKIGQLMCSKICHDLISPIGAVHNGIEITNKDLNGLNKDIFSLLQQGSNNAIQILIYYRIAFGFAGIKSLDNPQAINDFLKQYLDIKNISLDLIIDQQVLDSNNLSRIIINLASIVSEFAPNGGIMTIVAEKHTQQDIEVKLEGNLVIIKEDIKQALTGNTPEDAINAINIQSFMTYNLAKTINANIGIIESSKQHLVIKLQNNLHLQQYDIKF